MHTDLAALLSDLSLPDASWVGLREVREELLQLQARDGKPERTLRNRSQGVMVEVLVDGAFGYAATSRRDREGIQAAAERAAGQARAAAPWAVHRFTEAVRPPSVGAWRSPGVEGDEWSPGLAQALLGRICERMRVSDEIVRTTAAVRRVEVEQRLVSSSGADVRQASVHLATDWSATAQRGSVVQKRTDAGSFARCLQGGWELLEAPDLWQRVDAVGREVLVLLDAEECPTDNRTLVLAPDQMLLQIHESIGHPLELDRILGDERNYAGSSFVRLEDFGTLRYGSPLLTVSWDPTVAGENASYGFDEVGAEARRELLIDRGLLVRGLGSLESEARSGVPGVATQRSASWNRAPIDRMANLNLEPGDTPGDALIANVERGVLMRSNRSWSIDDRRDKFQFGCEWGQLIEDGRLTKVVRNPNYRGRTSAFWHGLTAVGDRATREVYGTPFCGKGEPNQVIRVGHASPMCRFDGVDVFGGAS